MDLICYSSRLSEFVNKSCFTTTLHLIMSQEKDVGDDVEMDLHGDEMDNVELDPEKERSLDPGSQMRKVNTKDQERVEAQEIYQARHSLRGNLA